MNRAADSAAGATGILLVGRDPGLCERIERWLAATPGARYDIQRHAAIPEEMAAGRVSPPPACVLAISEPGEGPAALERVVAAAKRADVPLVAVVPSAAQEASARKAGASDAIARELLTPELLRRVVGYAIERAEWERVLTHQEALYRALVNTAVDSVITFDKEGVILFFNPAAEPLFGYPAEEAVGMHIDRLVPSLLERLEAHEGRERSARKLRRGLRRQTVARRSDGKTFPVDITVSRLSLGSRRLFTCIVRDATEQRRVEQKIRDQLARAEARLAQNERMAALGTIGAGVAHELNNPLMGLLNEIEFALTRAPAAGPLREALTHALADARRCKAIVRDLLSYARAARPGGVDVTEDANAVIQQVIRDLEGDLREGGVQVALRLDPTPAPVAIGETQLRQVLTNLFLNARDAMEDSAHRLLTVETNAHDSSVVVFIQDTGPGMTEDQRARVFEPFYTTKGPGRGTGLGLFLSRNLIESAGGRLSVVSTPGVGSTFVAVLPRLQLPPES